MPAVIDRLDGRPFDLNVYLDAMRSTNRYKVWAVPDEVLERALDADPPSTLAEALRLTYRAYAWHVGKSGYADKTPSHIMLMDRIAAVLPETRFVHLIRDGRDVALALRDASFGPRSIDEAALHWRSRVNRGCALGSELGPERYREVRYEALVEDPQSTVRETCEFLGLVFREEMLDYVSSAEALVAGAQNPGAHDRLAEPIRKGVRDWRQEMTRGEVARFEVLAGPLLDDLGYERGAPQPTMATRVEVTLRYARLKTIRRYRQARRLNSVSWW